MAAKETNLNEATEPMEEEYSELDQPDDIPRMSLEQLLNGEQGDEADDEDGEPSQQAEESPENADRKDGKRQDGFRSQAEFDKAFGQRQAGMRRQWERENAEAFAIAETVRRRYQGKSAAEIQEAMLLEEARELSMETGYSEEEAVKKVRARHSYEQRAKATENDIDPEVLERVAGQLNSYAEQFGIDLEDEIEKDQSLLKFIGKDGDLSGVMIQVQARRLAGDQRKPEANPKPNRKAPPKPETSGAARSAAVARDLSDSDIDRIDRMAKRGIHVTV